MKSGQLYIHHTYIYTYITLLKNYFTLIYLSELIRNTAMYHERVWYTNNISSLPLLCVPTLLNVDPPAFTMFFVFIFNSFWCLIGLLSEEEKDTYMQ
jgi:hypothetical protein